ncbi:hypothetical protein M0812_18667 [Anaeramoeba flamelloides]|uniref:BTB domain-containing protein n=1 Tax=Anaeramoeba flamelloides TaxID=1746091 RepID=A0AAV7Z8Y3_9EUKA|nr:hypothetical protein M0812_18667 [Anaeramoeba flamelloides]
MTTQSSRIGNLLYDTQLSDVEFVIFQEKEFKKQQKRRQKHKKKTNLSAHIHPKKQNENKQLFQEKHKKSNLSDFIKSKQETARRKTNKQTEKEKSKSKSKSNTNTNTNIKKSVHCSLGEHSPKKQHFYAHKLLLSLSSPFFRNLFYPTNWRMSNKLTYRVVINDLNPCVFSIILDYIYTNQAKFNHENCVSVLIAAKKFELFQLCELAEDYFLKNLTPKTFLQFYKEKYNLTNPLNIRKLNDYFVLNFDRLLNEPKCLENLPNEYIDLVFKTYEKCDLLQKENFFKRLIQRIDKKNYSKNESSQIGLKRKKFLLFYNYDDQEIYQLYPDLIKIKVKKKKQQKKRKQHLLKNNQIEQMQKNKSLFKKNSYSLNSQLTNLNCSDCDCLVQKPSKKSSFETEIEQKHQLQLLQQQRAQQQQQNQLQKQHKKQQEKQLQQQLPSPPPQQQQPQLQKGFPIQPTLNRSNLFPYQIVNPKINPLWYPNQSLLSYFHNTQPQFNFPQQLVNPQTKNNKNLPHKQKQRFQLLQQQQQQQLHTQPKSSKVEQPFPQIKNQNNDSTNHKQEDKRSGSQDPLGAAKSLRILSKKHLGKKKPNQNFQVLLLTTDTNQSHKDDVILSIKTGGFENIDQIDCSQTTPTLGEISRFDCIFIYSTIEPFKDASTLGNILADYVDDGGGLVISSYRTMIKNPFKWKNSKLEGRLVSLDFLPCQAGELVSLKRAKLGKILLKDHPLIKGLENFDGGTKSYRITTKFQLNSETEGQLIAKWADGIPFIAWKKKKQTGSGMVVFLNFQPVSGNCYQDRGRYSHWLNTDGRKMISNAIRWAIFNDLSH